MCTAVAYNHKNFCFGRTLDFEYLYPCKVIFTPRNFPFGFSFEKCEGSHYAMLGMACAMDDYPLYFDAVNEKGLCVAGLNFVGNAMYQKPKTGKRNVASFDFIPYVLGYAKNTQEAKALLQNINITDENFKDDLPASKLHWIISDKEESLVVESVAQGVQVYTNPAGVLTNNPPFEYQLRNLETYSFLTPHQGKDLELEEGYSSYTRGTGAVGLPGDYTSKSRFVRAAFLRKYSHAPDTSYGGVNQLFHILSGVAVPEGACKTEKGEYNKTLYTCVIDGENKVYSFKPYESQGVFSVDMKKENPDSDTLVCYPFLKEAQFINLN